MDGEPANEPSVGNGIVKASEIGILEIHLVDCLELSIGPGARTLVPLDHGEGAVWQD